MSLPQGTNGPRKDPRTRAQSNNYRPSASINPTSLDRKGFKTAAEEHSDRWSSLNGPSNYLSRVSVLKQCSLRSEYTKKYGKENVGEICIVGSVATWLSLR